MPVLYFERDGIMIPAPSVPQEIKGWGVPCRQYQAIDLPYAIPNEKTVRLIVPVCRDPAIASPARGISSGRKGVTEHPVAVRKDLALA